MDHPPSGPTAEARAIRLLIVDDDEGIRTLLEVTVSLDARFELVGAAATAADALACIEACSSGDGACPDVVLLDVTLPDGDGIDVMRSILGFSCVDHVALFTGWSDAATQQRAKDAGAEAVFSKDGDPRKLLDGLAALVV